MPSFMIGIEEVFDAKTRPHARRPCPTAGHIDLGLFLLEDRLDDQVRSANVLRAVGRSACPAPLRRPRGEFPALDAALQRLLDTGTAGVDAGLAHLGDLHIQTSSRVYLGDTRAHEARTTTPIAACLSSARSLF